MFNTLIFATVVICSIHLTEASNYNPLRPYHNSTDGELIEELHQRDAWHVYRLAQWENQDMGCPCFHMSLYECRTCTVWGSSFCCPFMISASLSPHYGYSSVLPIAATVGPACGFILLRMLTLPEDGTGHRLNQIVQELRLRVQERDHAS